MQLNKILAVALIFTIISCKKNSSNSSNSTTNFKATLVAVGGSGFSGSATGLWDGYILTLNITHNMGTVSAGADGFYNKYTGIQAGYFLNKTSPFTYITDLNPSANGSVSDLMTNSYEIRFHTAAGLVLVGTITKQ